MNNPTVTLQECMIIFLAMLSSKLTGRLPELAPKHPIKVRIVLEPAQLGDHIHSHVFVGNPVSCQVKARIHGVLFHRLSKRLCEQSHGSGLTEPHVVRYFLDAKVRGHTFVDIGSHTVGNERVHCCGDGADGLGHAVDHEAKRFEQMTCDLAGPRIGRELLQPHLAPDGGQAII